MKRVNRENVYNSLVNTDRLKIPTVHSLASVGDEPGMEGNVILDRNTQSFCYHDGSTWVCLQGSGGGGGNVNGQNVGVGPGQVFSNVSGDTLFFHTLTSNNGAGEGSGGITITTGANEVNLVLSETAEINGANLGAGIPFFANTAVVGNTTTLNFRTLTSDNGGGAGSGGLTITNDANGVNLIVQPNPLTFPLQSTIDGSATTPAFSFINDTDVGMYLNSAGNQLNLVAGGLSGTALSVDANGGGGIQAGPSSNNSVTWNIKPELNTQTGTLQFGFGSVETWSMKTTTGVNPNLIITDENGGTGDLDLQVDTTHFGSTLQTTAGAAALQQVLSSGSGALNLNSTNFGGGAHVILNSTGTSTSQITLATAVAPTQTITAISNDILINAANEFKVTETVGSTDVIEIAANGGNPQTTIRSENTSFVETFGNTTVLSIDANGGNPNVIETSTFLAMNNLTTVINNNGNTVFFVDQQGADSVMDITSNRTTLTSGFGIAKKTVIEIDDNGGSPLLNMDSFITDHKSPQTVFRNAAGTTNILEMDESGPTVIMRADVFTLLDDSTGTSRLSMAADSLTIWDGLDNPQIRADSNGLGFFGTTPTTQQTSTLAPASDFVQNSGNPVNDNSTFNGYTLQQVVKALQNYGLLA